MPATDSDPFSTHLPLRHLLPPPVVAAVVEDPVRSDAGGATDQMILLRLARAVKSMRAIRMVTPGPKRARRGVIRFGSAVQNRFVGQELVDLKEEKSKI